MRLQLTPARRLLRALALGLALLAVGPAPGHGEDRVSVHGAYFREPSTRVVQPMIQLAKDLPYGFDVSAHFLVDAITSASVAAGTTQDSIFTEFRKEEGVVVGKTFDRTHVALAYRDSHEPDYISRTFGLQLTQGVWDNSGMVSVSAARSSDTIGPNLNQYLDVYFLGAAYTQALTPTLVGQVGYEVSYLGGYQANPYLQVPDLGRDRLPPDRLRHALAARLAYYLPRWRIGLQAHYRYYMDNAVHYKGPDPWGLTAHTVEGRVYWEIFPELELRLSYRYHTQGAAAFWCSLDPSRGGAPDCYGPTALYYSADVKLGPLSTHIPELKLIWEARGLAGVPVLGWLAGGEFDVSYARYFQSTPFGDANLLETGYSLPF